VSNREECQSAKLQLVTGGSRDIPLSLHLRPVRFRLLTSTTECRTDLQDRILGRWELAGSYGELFFRFFQSLKAGPNRADCHSEAIRAGG
jgi:hypothetical protein